MKDIGSREDLLARIKYLEEEFALLKEREHKLAAAVEHSPATIVITNKDGDIEYANSTFAETGYSIEEVLGKNPRILHSGMHTPKFYSNLWNQISSGKVWDGEFYNKRKDGSFYWEHARIAPVKNDAGEINNYVAIKFDITQQKEYEKQLKINEEKFKTIFDLAPLVIIFYDLNFQLIDCNQQFLNYLVIQDKANVIGMNVLDFLPIEERESAQQDLVKALTGLNYYIFVNGEKRYIEVSTNLVYNEKKEPAYAIAIIRDVTQLKQAEQKLKELIATKDKFFSVIANHLKNPFSAIVGFSNILSEDNFNDSPSEDKIRQVRHIAVVINEAAKRAAGLIENLLTWSLTQTGNLEFHPQKLILRQLVNDALSDFKKQALNKAIDISNEVPELMEAYAEIPMLKTIMRILINNAVKYTVIGGKIKINATNHQDYTKIVVSDTGIGIPPDVWEKLFKIDSKYHLSGTAEEQGAGLGLILCKDLVERHGGEIYIESKVGKGSDFVVTLPKVKE